MLRITEIYEDKKIAKLKIEGKIVNPCIWDLEKLCCHYMSNKGKKVVLDFEGVTYIDNEGLKMIDSLRDKKLKIINCSPFIRLLLDFVETGNIRKGKKDGPKQSI